LLAVFCVHDEENAESNIIDVVCDAYPARIAFAHLTTVIQSRNVAYATFGDYLTTAYTHEMLFVQLSPISL